jgi:hypothetical protein
MRNRLEIDQLKEESRRYLVELPYRLQNFTQHRGPRRPVLHERHSGLDQRH